MNTFLFYQEFLPHIGQFFDETFFCSSGYTASESLRSNAASIVAELVHNARKQLTYQEICKAFTYFSKSLHDPLLHINLQHMCCKVLLSLIESVKSKENEPTVNPREFILKLLQVFVLKFKSIAKYQVTYLLENHESISNGKTTDSILPTTILTNDSTEKNTTTLPPLNSLSEKKSKIDKLDSFLNTFEDKDKIKLKYGPSSVIIQSELDLKTTIKFLILACRSITGIIIDTKLAQNDISMTMQAKQLTPKETIIFIKLLKNALQSLDIFMLGRQQSNKSAITNNASLLNNQKEEKEAIESLGAIFSSLNPQTLKEIFSQTIDFIIERTFKNSSISILSSYFLATPATSFTFATILIEYLLKKMEIMGDTSIERSNLYLKLFKLVFGSVSVFPSENEKMLKPHLHSLVTKSLEYALKAKEPYNYFLLLRALFRSIGGGNHDLLYQEFLPLLPVLLQSLNELQTGIHKQYLKDLFVELCLTVPVRLSSLLPYLPMLMDPLVSALNGSPTLISQGLRTLELCVDNLQPDFLYDHIQPVRTDLIQGLWRTLRSQNDSIAQAAFRVLGKLGGSNRKMIVEPQQLKFNQNSIQSNLKEFNGPTIKILFTNYTTNNLELSLEKVIDTCYSILRTTSNSISTTSQTNTSSTIDQTFYKKHAFKIATSFFSSLISSKSSLNNATELNSLFLNYNPTFTAQFTQHLLKYQKFDDKHLRKIVEKSLICLIYATSIKEIKAHAVSLLDSIVIHLTLLSLAHYNNQDETKLQQLIKMNIFSSENNNSFKYQLLNLDFMILVDCMYSVLCNDDMEYWPTVQRYILIMIETSEIVAGDSFLDSEKINELNSKYILRDNLPNLALFDYLAEKINQLCYERSWLAKKASCQIIRLLTQKMPFAWVLNNFYSFLKSLMFILVSVSSEISSGAIDVSQKSIEDLVKFCASKLNKIETNTLTQNELNTYNQLVELQQKSLNEVIKELIRQLTSSNIYVRTQSIQSLKLISELQSKTVHSLIQPFNDILIETVGPRKHLKLRHYPPQSQIGILDGLEFCSSTQPQLFVLNMSSPEHSNLFQELIPICEGDENQLLKNVCYKNLNDMTPLRKSALNALASFYHLLEQRETILSTLHRALASTNQEIQQVAFSCLQKFIKNTENYSSSLRSTHNQAVQAHQNGQGPPPQPLHPGMENLRQTMQIAADYLREYLHPLTEYTSLNLNVIQHLSYITQLYPTILNEKFSEYLLTNLRRWLDEIVKIVNENKTTTQNALVAAQEAARTTNVTLSLSVLQNQLKSYENELKLCSAIISLLAELQSAPSKLVETAIATVLKYESEFMLEVNGNFRLPLSNFLKRYPFETLKYLLHSDRIKNMYNYRFILFLIRTQSEFSRIFKSDSHRLIQMLDESHSLYSNAQQMILNNTNTINNNNNNESQPSQISTQQNPNDLVAKSNQIQYLTILIIYRLVKQDNDNKWIIEQSRLIDCLLKIWCDERFHDKHRNIDQLDCVYWKEPIYLIKILLKFHKAQLDASHISYPIQSNVELLFKLLIAFQNKSLQQYEFLRLYFKDQVAKSYTCEWKRAAFFTFVKIFNETSADSTLYQYSQRLKANILQYILIPCFQNSFEKNQHYELIGGAPQPDIDTDDNLISVFINKVVDPDNPFSISDSVRIFILQLSSLFVQYAHDYIHDVNNKKQGNKLRRLMTFAWPCLLAKNCVDPFNKYHGHLLLSHIISKYSIHKRIVLQVFHSLLKAYAPEAKVVVRQALEILTPSFPTRIEDGYLTLASWTKKILIEESQTVSQLAHMLYIIVKYHKVYYLIRHTLINHLISSFQKVGLAANSTPENRTLSIDLTEVILRWESQRAREIQIIEYNQLKQHNSNLIIESNVDFTQEQRQLEILSKKYPDMLKQFDKNVADCIINFFVRMACPPVDQSQQQNQPQISNNNNQTNPSDSLSKRCLNLFKTAISNEIWQQADLKLDILDRLMTQLDSTNLISLNGTGIASNYQAATTTNQTASTSTQYQNTTTPNYNSICTAIEIITFLVENLNGSRNKIQLILKSVQRGLTVCLMSTDSRVVRSISQLIQKLMQILPTDCFNNNPNVNSNTNSSSNNTSTSSSNNNPLTSPTSASSNLNPEQHNDPIYNLFGQPEGILCRVIIEGLSYYDKSSSIATSIASDSPFSNQSLSLSTSIEVLTNCLLLLKSASMNNPQYIDRIMGPFMRILQKLYRDHLNSTGVVLTTNSSSIQIPPASASAEGSNVMVGPNQTTINSFSELLIQCLDLIKFRIGVMSIDMRKMFINSILVTLIDKSIDLRLIKYLVKTIADWIKYKNGGPLMNQIPSLKEKLVLLQRLTVAVEKRFSDHTDIQQIFLETIAYVYKDDLYAANNEFKVKLEHAFLCGLKCSNAKTRQLFFDLFNSNFSCVDLYERLCYILVTQNWEPFGTHYWIKQCIQMTLGACARSEMMIRFSDLAANRFHFPSLLNASECVYGNVNYNSLAEISPNENDIDASTAAASSSTISVINNVASGVGEQIPTITTNITEPIVINLDINLNEKTWHNANENLLESVVDSDDMSEISTKKFMKIFYNKKESDSNLISAKTTTTASSDVEMKTEEELFHDQPVLKTRSQLIEILVKNQLNLFQFLNRIKIGELIVSICQLCHQNNELAHGVWIQLFVQMFNLLQSKQQQNLYGELTPFIASGSHCIQKQTSLSTLNTFLESFAMSKTLCLYLRPSLLSYLAKNHNLWHRAILLLENSITNPNSDTQNSELVDLQQQSVGLQSIQNESFSSLSQLYLALKEDDYRTGIWYKKAIHENTKIAFMYEQQGLFYQAQKVYEEIISKSVDIYLNDSNSSNPDELLEYNLWEERWVRCCKELNQWNELSEYATTKDNDINLCLECALKQQAPNHWQLVKSLLLSQKDSNLPKDQSWRWSLYQAYYLVCNLDDYHHLLLASGSNPTSLQTVFSPNAIIESRVERCIHLALKEWRRLPRLVSPAHITLLQASQQIVELQEAFQIQNNLNLMSQQQTQINPTSTLQEIKGIIKTWRTRLPLINDDLSYWNDIFTWRQYHYEAFTKFYEKQTTTGTNANPAMLGVHALAQGIVHFGKISRKQHLYDLCLETLNKIHKKQSVPIIDCFLKVRILSTKLKFTCIIFVNFS
jgi:transformation/transcription domain-associated protein